MSKKRKITPVRTQELLVSSVAKSDAKHHRLSFGVLAREIF